MLTFINRKVLTGGCRLSIQIFNQKKRNRPIKITDVAVSKVARANLSNFSDKGDIFIQEQHKRLLVISKEMNNSKEVRILIDIIHWYIWTILGEANVIETRNNLDAYLTMKGSGKNTMLFMHNHPSTDTFSGTDVKTFCVNEALYIMTVVGNDGSIKTLKKLNGFDKYEALLYYNKLATQKYKRYRNNGARAMKELLKNCDKIKLSYRSGGK